MNNFTLYMHTVPNGKKYIGITNKDPKKRWNGGSGYASNSKFYTDIKKYGWDNIKHKILLENVSQEKAEEWKAKIIEKFNTTDPKHGYNSAENKISDQTKQKISEGVNKTPCICIETGKKYKSIASAARLNGTSRSAIHTSCATNGRRAAKGFHFIYLDEEKRKSATLNEVLRESMNWDWDW